MNFGDRLVRYIARFFEEDNYNSSILRLMAFILELTTVFILIWDTCYNIEYNLGLIAILLTTAFGGKIGQKALEQKMAQP